MTFEAENKAMKPKKGKATEADPKRNFFFPQKGDRRAQTIKATSLEEARKEYDKKSSKKVEEPTNE